MHPTSAHHPAGSELETALAAVEQRLSGLGEALRLRDLQAIETQASELHGALAGAVQHFAQAARRGGVPPELRSRLARASGEVAEQRESLARATAALDRAIDVLMPGVSSSNASGYGAAGQAERGSLGGVLQA